MRKLLFLFIVSFFSVAVKAQFADSVKAQLIRDWERAKAYTKEYLEAMPKDKYDFKAQDSTRSFGEQMLHLAQGNIGLVSNGTSAPRIWQGRNLTKQPADSVIYYTIASYDYAIESISKMDANKLGEKFKRGNFDLDRFTWLLKAFEHQTHHRGQTTIYIRLAGVKPPNEKLF